MHSLDNVPSFFARVLCTTFNYKWKKEMFVGLDNLTITCPSEWMKDKVEQSFLKDTKCIVVPNGIDFSVFYPHKNDNVTGKYGIPIDKKVILGVASIWEERKGLNDFIELAEILPQEYVIVLVGLTGKQMRKISADNVIGIRRTENQDELAHLYSLATVFMNPSKEESFSLVTIEAMACGTPVIALAYSAPKELVNKDSGILLSKTGAEDYLDAIRRIESAGLLSEKIVDSVKYFSVENMTDEMLEQVKSFFYNFSDFIGYYQFNFNCNFKKEKERKNSQNINLCILHYFLY